MFDYVVKQGDSLSLLSAKFFGNVSDYLKIYYANPQLKGRGDSKISEVGYLIAGETIKIPVFQENTTKPKSREELENRLRVCINGKETAVSSLQFNASFDSFSNSFSFDCPLLEKKKVSPLGYERITIEVGNEKVLEGIIENLSANGRSFSCSGKSITSLLEKTCVSGSDLGFSFSRSSVNIIANRFGKQYGINFKSDKSAIVLANKLLPVAEISETESISSILSKISQELGLYMCCDNLNNLYFRKNDYVGKNIAVISMSENDEFPIQNLKVDYNGSALHSIYSLYFSGSENNDALSENRILPVCKSHRIKRIISSKKGQNGDVLNTEIKKALLGSTKVSFSLPFIKIKDKIIECGNTFDLTAANYGIEKKTRFFITDISFKFEPNSQSCQISACLSSAIGNNSIKF